MEQNLLKSYITLPRTAPSFTAIGATAVIFDRRGVWDIPNIDGEAFIDLNFAIELSGETVEK